MRIILLLVFTALLPSAVSAGKLPKGAYFWDDYETAKKEAIANKRPILFVYTNLNTK